jgi:tetratricopeptide (TPR) repeat protein
LAVAELHLGRTEEALSNADHAIRLSPNDPLLWTSVFVRATALFKLGRYNDAVEAIELAMQHPNAQYLTFLTAVAIYLKTDRSEKAERALQTAMSMEPNLSIKRLTTEGIRVASVVHDDLVAAWRKFGLPEE